MMAKFFTLLLILFAAASSILGQKIQGDTTFASIAVANAKSLYSKTMKDQVQLYNGSDYADYKPLKEEHPYFISEDWITGSVHYNGELFKDVPLLYNIYRDQVIAENYFGASMIQLIPARIKYFTLDGHTFVRLDRNTVLASGFYDLLFDGSTKVYAKRIKEFQETISYSEIERDFHEKTRYYIYHSDQYFLVRSKRSVLHVLEDKKHELNRFLHKNHIRFRNDRENAIVMMTKFYTGN